MSLDLPPAPDLPMPVVTQAMIGAGAAAMRAVSGNDPAATLHAIYLAMYLRRPLSEGPR